MSTTNPLVRFSLTEAAAQLSITTTTLKKLIKGKGIEAALGGYTLKQLVAAMMPAEGDSREASLAAHSRLQSSKAKLVEHQLTQAEGKFIERQAGLNFLGLFMRWVYDFIYYRGGLLEAVRKELEIEIQERALRFYLERGWMLEPEYTFSQNGNSSEKEDSAEPVEPENRRVLWARAVNAVLIQVASDNEDGKHKDHSDAGRLRARRHRVRHPRANS